MLRRAERKRQLRCAYRRAGRDRLAGPWWRRAGPNWAASKRRPGARRVVDRQRPTRHRASGRVHHHASGDRAPDQAGRGRWRARLAPARDLQRRRQCGPVAAYLPAWALRERWTTRRLPNTDGEPAQRRHVGDPRRQPWLGPISGDARPQIVVDRSLDAVAALGLSRNGGECSTGWGGRPPSWACPRSAACARARRQDLGRLLRHGVLFSGLSAATSSGGVEDRPLLRRRDRPRATRWARRLVPSSGCVTRWVRDVWRRASSATRRSPPFSTRVASSPRAPCSDVLCRLRRRSTCFELALRQPKECRWGGVGSQQQRRLIGPGFTGMLGGGNLATGSRRWPLCLCRSHGR